MVHEFRQDMTVVLCSVISENSALQTRKLRVTQALGLGSSFGSFTATARSWAGVTRRSRLSPEVPTLPLWAAWFPHSMADSVGLWKSQQENHSLCDTLLHSPMGLLICLMWNKALLCARQCFIHIILNTAVNKIKIIATVRWLFWLEIENKSTRVYHNDKEWELSEDRCDVTCGLSYI